MNWNYPKQKFLSESGELGDCWRCCIAAMLQLPIDDVPHFLMWAKKNGSSMHPDTQKWLNERGYCLVQANEFSFPRWAGKGFDGMPVIASGPTSRSKTMREHHAVIMLGDKLLYDPHPSEDGLTAVTQMYLVVPLFPESKPCNCGGLCPACASEK